MSGFRGIGAIAARMQQGNRTVITRARRLVIQGSGFAEDKFTGSNAVLVGSMPCNVLNHQSSATMVRVVRVVCIMRGMRQDNLCTALITARQLW